MIDIYIYIYVSFAHMVEIQFSARIKTFKSGSCREFLHSMSLLHPSSRNHSLTIMSIHPCTRWYGKKKTLSSLDTISTLLQSSRVPLSFWEEALYCCIYYQPLSIHFLSGRTPFETLFHQKPDYSDLHPFGLIPHDQSKLSQVYHLCLS